MWTARDVRFSFSGLIGQARLESLRRWVHESHGGVLRGPGRLKLTVRGASSLRGVPSGVRIIASRRGRSYPVKAWDPTYFHLLARSQFAICPSGDFAWTYRVFEAALCGAIPIVEERCDSYGDLFLYSTDDSVQEFAWTNELAEHNRREARRLVTVPTPQLEQALRATLT